MDDDAGGVAERAGVEAEVDGGRDDDAAELLAGAGALGDDVAGEVEVAEVADGEGEAVPHEDPRAAHGGPLADGPLGVGGVLLDEGDLGGEGVGADGGGEVGGHGWGLLGGEGVEGVAGA